MTKEEMEEFVPNIGGKYFLTGLWKKREDFYSIQDEELRKNPYYIIGMFLILVMQGELKKADELLETVHEENILTLSLRLVRPGIPKEDFFTIVEKIKACPVKMDKMIIITGGRPYVLNGLVDVTFLGPELESRKGQFIEMFENVYGKTNAKSIYYQCLAEYYYQQNRCYDAELFMSRAINAFSAEGDMRCLFAALFGQLLLLIVNNQCPSISGYFKEMRTRLSGDGAKEIMYNMAAMEAWISSYKGDYEYIFNWFNTDAPDEYGDFNMLDLFRYMVKLRCYLIQKNHIALVALVEKLRPYLAEGKRIMDLCLLEYIYAMSLHDQGKKKDAFKALERGLAIARKNHFDRLAADEGDRMLQLLLDYHRENPKDEYVLHLIGMTRKIAIYYPYYLKTPEVCGEKFTEEESDILRLLEQGKNNREIADCYLISENTVKYHLKKIYGKLGVKTALAAVWKAKFSGVI